MTLTRTLSQLLILSSALIFALSVNYIYAEVWQGPPAGTPPANNVDTPINVGITTQVKDGNLSVGASANSSSTLGFSVYGAGATRGWQRIGAVTPPSQLLELTGRPGIDGIKFPDGSLQTTAAVTTSGIGSAQIVGYVCQGDADCGPSWSCTSFGQNPVCNTAMCPTGKTLASFDEIDRWTDSGCTNTGGGGQCQGPWSRTYYRVVGLCD